jgi:hypothetical protein
VDRDFVSSTAPRLASAEELPVLGAQLNRLADAWWSARAQRPRRDDPGKSIKNYEAASVSDTCRKGWARRIFLPHFSSLN